MLVTMPAASASAAQLYILRYKKYSGAKKNAEKLKPNLRPAASMRLNWYR